MDLVEFPDPAAEILAYLAPRIPGLPDGAWSQDPRPDAHQGLWLQVADAGGDLFEQVFDDARLTVELSEPDAEIASAAARRADALLRAYATPKGRWLALISRPHYAPDSDLRIPAYQLTHTIRFRGVEVTVP